MKKLKKMEKETLFDLELPNDIDTLLRLVYNHIKGAKNSTQIRKLARDYLGECKRIENAKATDLLYKTALIHIQQLYQALESGFVRAFNKQLITADQSFILDEIFCSYIEHLGPFSSNLAKQLQAESQQRVGKYLEARNHFDIGDFRQVISFWLKVVSTKSAAIEKQEKWLEKFLESIWEDCCQGDWKSSLHFSNTTFAFPSHAIMLTLLPVFSGKAGEKLSLIRKSESALTHDEKKLVNTLVSSILETKEIYDYSEGTSNIVQKQVAIVCDNPKVEARAEIDQALFKNDPVYRSQSLAMYIKRTFGIEGLRHLLGLVIGLEENYRQGYFKWNLNEHLERLGYKKKNRAFDVGAKRIASEIVRIFGSLFITVRRKQDRHEEIIGQRLFSIDAFTQQVEDKEIIDETLTIRATEFWYRFNDQSRTKSEERPYTILMKKLVQENHKNHAITIYLTTLLSIFWRMNTSRKISVSHLMEWCEIDLESRLRLKHLRELEDELNYMKENNYLGDWINDGEDPLPSKCKDPFSCCLTLLPPTWLKERVKEIESKKVEFKKQKQPVATISVPKEKEKLKKTPKKVTKHLISKDFLMALWQKTQLSLSDFAKELEISKSMLSLIKNNKKEITNRISEKALFLAEKLGFKGALS
jgi:DNA-binding transcriptional regulator YiaG